MFEEDDFHIRPERVDERLAALAGESFDKQLGLTRRKVNDVQAEFLEATKPRQSMSGRSDATHSIDREMPSALNLSTRVRTSSDLPLDVFLEIAYEVTPLDLINLAQTSKTLRRLLMSKKNRAVWTSALGDVPEFPPCPTDMCEPLYAALVFGKYCFGCGVGDAFWVDYALRLRMCVRCYKANVIVGSQVLKSVPQHSRNMIRDAVLMLLPSANTFDFSDPVPSFDPINPLSHHIEDFYFKPEFEAMFRFFWPLPVVEDITELRPLLRTRVNYVMTRQAHAALLHAWDNYCFEPSDGEDGFADIKSSLQSPEFSQLRGRDWDKSALYSDPAFTAYIWGKDDTPELDPAEPKPKPTKQLARERRAFERREELERNARLRARVREVAEWQKKIHSQPPLAQIAPAELPNAYTNSRVWDPFVCGGNARDPFDPLDRPGEIEPDPDLVQRVAHSVAEYPGKVMRFLACQLERSEARSKDARTTGKKQPTAGRKNGAKQDARDVVRRPTALFYCKECEDGPLAYPAINVHWQKAHADKSVWMGDATETVYGAGVWEDGVRIAQNVLAVLIENGLPKNKRDIGSLDGLIKEGRVFCSCGDPEMETREEEFGWAELVCHVFMHLKYNSLRTKTITAQMPDSSMVDIPVWLDDHDLTSCIKYLRASRDTTSEAPKHVTADKATRERIEGLLGQCPETSKPACLLCDRLTPDDKKDDTLFLSDSADAIVYHMQAKHGKHFEEKDVVF
ncbi:hypothetical protein GSI_03150 [Ganoderma sinense ZZ0214-1]|uniref:F-box domain-containing protein n=1 Tax=Ganoderma sinense ZZ0214-1 TaxID=1077348 RepID=A0A2G8SKT4_9APHY|nr:hypothetical protein GSI_03150 [Ganoderma sinense ZZ0214-1]